MIPTCLGRARCIVRLLIHHEPQNVYWLKKTPTTRTKACILYESGNNEAIKVLTLTEKR